MTVTRGNWWGRLRVHQKVWTLLAVVFVPLIGALVVPVYFVIQLQAFQLQHHQIVLAREQVQILRRLAVDVEDAFRGYLLTGNEEFLKPLQEAEPKVRPTVKRVTELAQNVPGLVEEVQGASDKLEELLKSKHALIAQVRSNRLKDVLAYVRSGQGLALSDAVRDDLRKVEDVLELRMKGFEQRETRLVGLAFWGLALAVAGTFALALLHTGLLSRSITGPIAALEESVEQLRARFRLRAGRAGAGAVSRTDEIEQLASGFEDMAEQIRAHLRERDALNAISHEINTIGADGLHGVLRRITDRAVDLLQVDVCLVMIRNDEMGCWVVEAASSPWNERIRNTVMLWEEFPVSAKAFETGEPAIGEVLHRDQEADLQGRSLLGRNRLAIPLLSQGKPFGVLTLLQHREGDRESWNVPLAMGFANEAAVAMANARLFDAVYQKEQRLESRLRQLEHMAETMAHDMKGPGERLGGLASALLTSYSQHLDDKARRWLRLMDEEGKELSARIENLLEVARVGVVPSSLEAIDPAAVIRDVLTQRAEELECRRINVHVAQAFPAVACHRDYLRQVFDNLISNAMKFACVQPNPEIRVTVQRRDAYVFFSVGDNGPGIPAALRARVFEPFVRLQPDSSKGSGIGLTIVKRIVELYGGRVWIEPLDRPGCTVTFSLPVLGDLSDLSSIDTAVKSGGENTL